MTSKYYSLIRLKQLFTEGLRIVFAVICLFLILAIVAYLSNLINCTNCPHRSKYEGRVIDKTLTFSESSFGSKLRRRLLIRSSNGEEFEVVADESMYDRVKIGDWIQSN